MPDDSVQIKQILYFKGMGQTKVLLVRVLVFPHVYAFVHTHTYICTLRTWEAEG